MQEPVLQLYDADLSENTHTKDRFSKPLQALCTPFLHVLSLRENYHFRNVFVSGICPSLQERVG